MRWQITVVGLMWAAIPVTAQDTKTVVAGREYAVSGTARK